MFQQIEYFTADGFSECVGCDAVHVEGGENVDIIVVEHGREDALGFAPKRLGHQSSGSVEERGDRDLEHITLSGCLIRLKLFWYEKVSLFFSLPGMVSMVLSVNGSFYLSNGAFEWWFWLQSTYSTLLRLFKRCSLNESTEQRL